MLQVGKPIFFPIFLPLSTTPCTAHFLFKNLFAKLIFPFERYFLIKDDEIILEFFLSGLGLIILYLNFFSKFLYNQSFDLQLFVFSIKTFLFITLPVFIGIYLREKFNNFFKKYTFTLDRIAFVVFLVIVFIAIFTEKDNLINYFDDVGVTMSIILVLVFFSSFIITQIFVDDVQSKRAIRIEALLQNGAMGFVIGALIFSEIKYLIPITIYALLQYCFLLFYLGNMKIKK